MNRGLKKNGRASKCHKDEVCRLFASLNSSKEAKRLLEQLLTPAEYDEIARRWQIVRLLMKGSSQWDVAGGLGVGIATVTRGARELNNGNGIFQKMYERLYSK